MTMTAQAPDPELEMLRGRQAEKLLNDPLLQEALTIIEQRYETAWKSSALSHVQVREEAYRMLATCTEFKRQLTSILTTGKMAAKAESDRQDTATKERELRDWDGSASTAPNRIGGD